MLCSQSFDFFSVAKLNSIKVIKDVLAEFEGLSRLRANPVKSTCFGVGISGRDKEAILNLLQMNEDVFLIRYLGVPFITKKLMAADCESLVSTITARINSWLVKHLSFAGQLQLIKSVLCSLQVYWCRIFILPKKVISLLEHKLNRFLWCGQDVKAKAKVTWYKFCTPRKEVGLGIKKLEV